MNETLNLARRKAVGNGRISHASKEGHGRLARLGIDYIYACIQRLNRMVFFHPGTQTVQSSLGKTEVVQDGNLACAIVRPDEILNFGLKPGEGVGRNLVSSVVAF